MNLVFKPINQTFELNHLKPLLTLPQTAPHCFSHKTKELFIFEVNKRQTWIVNQDNYFSKSSHPNLDKSSLFFKSYCSPPIGLQKYPPQLVFVLKRDSFKFVS